MTYLKLLLVTRLLMSQQIASEGLKLVLPAIMLVGEMIKPNVSGPLQLNQPSLGILDAAGEV
ncbi:MAG: hypothetical protein AAGE59_01365 [Cyanobacteria bacterium P01_F01_bin.86]